MRVVMVVAGLYCAVVAGARIFDHRESGVRLASGLIILAIGYVVLAGAA
ncbi:hypothetical protein [Xylanimonas protaetiae]|nr:hypothetical protein [Xylanimonas protaetiae]